MLADLQDFTATVDPIWQWLVIMAAGAVPFIESYGAGPLAIVAGVSPWIAIPAAIIGNIISMVLVVLLAGRVRGMSGADETPLTPRREKFRRRFNTWGVPGVSLLGQTMLPSQITSGLMVGFGASRPRVIVWQIVSITLWGVGIGLLVFGFVTTVTG